jgi:hypothetical protein
LATGINSRFHACSFPLRLKSPPKRRPLTKRSRGCKGTYCRLLPRGTDERLSVPRVRERLGIQPVLGTQGQDQHEASLHHGRLPTQGLSSAQSFCESIALAPEVSANEAQAANKYFFISCHPLSVSDMSVRTCPSQRSGRLATYWEPLRIPGCFRGPK